MKNPKIKNLLKNILPSAISVAAGILIGFYILLIAFPVNCLDGIGLILFGGFYRGIWGVTMTLQKAAPIIMTGLAAGFAFKTGLFNIGASGQFTVGAFAAILVGVKCTFLPPVIHTIAAILAAAAAGAVWAGISGALKAFFGVNEVISGIMLNYSGLYLTNLLIRSYAYNQNFNRSATVAASAVICSRAFDFNPVILIAAAMVFVIRTTLDRTAFGYELKTIGRNPDAGRYAGMDDKKSIVLTMMISGALCGIGAALMYLSDFGDYVFITDAVQPYGFTGISVALLGMSDPFGIFFAGILIAYLNVGGALLQLCGYSQDIIDMMLAAIIYCGALTVPVRMLLQKLLPSLYRKEEEK